MCTETYNKYFTENMDKLSACRICRNKVSVTHCVTLFSQDPWLRILQND